MYNMCNNTDKILWKYVKQCSYYEYECRDGIYATLKFFCRSSINGSWICNFEQYFCLFLCVTHWICVDCCTPLCTSSSEYCTYCYYFCSRSFPPYVSHNCVFDIPKLFCNEITHLLNKNECIMVYAWKCDMFLVKDKNLQPFCNPGNLGIYISLTVCLCPKNSLLAEYYLLKLKS